jgi:hypothetical protein
MNGEVPHSHTLTGVLMPLAPNAFSTITRSPLEEEDCTDMVPRPDVNLLERPEAEVAELNNESGITAFPGVSSNSADRRRSDPSIKTNEDAGEKEKGSSDYVSQEALQDAEIVWRYLTFETDLPHPSTIHPTQTGQEPPPEPPNLKKYTNPFDWSEKRKDFTIWVSCLITCVTAFSAGAYSPGVGQMTEEWGISSVAALVGITTFTTGFAFAPMVLAPFSESTSPQYTN